MNSNLYNELFYSNGLLEYQPSDHFLKIPALDRPWAIKVQKISVIAVWDKMVGDDDTHFLILIDANAGIWPMMTAYLSEDGRKNLNELIATFELELDPSEKFDHATILYPNLLYKKPLYKDSIFHRLKRGFYAPHHAIGELLPEVTTFLNV